MEHNNKRREFFRLLGGGGAAVLVAGSAAAKQQTPLLPAVGNTPSTGYHASSHIRRYYQSARF